MKKTATIFAALSILLTSSFGVGASDRLEQALDLVPAPAEEESEQKQRKQQWICKGCTDIENEILGALQERGITDNVALSVLMGNIKQESKFQTTICEGGKKTGYDHCHSGGFGLIQWTTHGRYNGLGRIARVHGLDPNSLDAQLKWMFAEREWTKVEYIFKTKGQTVDYYMRGAYRWLGWGVEGRRAHYANQYVHLLHFE